MYISAVGLADDSEEAVSKAASGHPLSHPEMVRGRQVAGSNGGPNWDSLLAHRLGRRPQRNGGTDVSGA